MRQRDENYLSMARAVQETLNRHQDVWNTMPRFLQAKQVLDGQILEVINLNTQSKIVTKGETENKANAETRAALLTVRLCDRAQVYALDQDDMGLWRQLEVSQKDLEDGADNDTLSNLRDKHSRLLALRQALASYGVTDADLALLGLEIEAFEADINKPRDLTVQRKGYNTSIPLLLRAMRSNFRVLDRLINMWDGSQLEGEYWDSRIIIDLGRRKEQEGEAPTP